MDEADIFKAKSNETEQYAQEYDEFMQTFKKTEVTGEEVGELIMRMGYYFTTYNLRMIQALKEFSGVKAVYMNGNDPATGKPMTASKAEVLSDATDEAFKYQMARAHIQNIEQCLNALKALQKGVINDYSHS